MKKNLFWLLVFILVIWAFDERRLLLMRITAFSDGGSPPEMLPPMDEGPGARWHDDYFTVHELAADTYAIGEPRYPYQNYSYLLIGDERALLFDGGPGMRNIRSVAESLTDRPITFLPSHLHFDHVANDVSFEHVALLDVEPVRARADGNTFSPSDRQFLGFIEGREPPVWEVDQWIAPGSDIDLGGRAVTALYTPGHTSDSVSLLDRQNGILFSGDYLYPGELWAFTPTSSMGDYLETAGPLLKLVTPEMRILGAHRGGSPGVPTLMRSDLRDLEQALQLLYDDVLQGEGSWPVVYPVNDSLELHAEPRILQDW